MDYTRNTWVNGASPAINATNLNNIEQGIVNVTNPDYDTTSDLSGVRSSVLSGNTNGALTQIVSGESAVNLLGDIGGFYRDSDNDGVADEWATVATTSDSISDQIQSFTATSQFGRFQSKLLSVTSGDIIHFMVDVETTSSLMAVDVYDGVAFKGTFNPFTGSGSFETGSFLYTADATSAQLAFWVTDYRSSGWTQTRVRKCKVINLTVEGDASLSLAQADLKYAKYFDNIGHATINQKITGTNGEFELKEPYVIPKDPAGGIDGTSEIVTLDGQNFVRMKHKLFVLDGDLAWSAFGSNTNTYNIQVNNFRTDNSLVTLTDSGIAINNDGKIDVIADFSDARHIVLVGGSTEQLVLYIEKALINAMPSGGTLAGSKEYLNANPIHAFFRIDSSANYVDIPIKHLASIENGTWENNSQILPSAITLTYPTNEAGERESAQVAQNQITNTKNNVIQEQSINRVGGQVEFIQPIYEQGTRIVRQGGLTQQVIEYNKTTTITRVNGQVAKVTEVPR